MHSPLATLKNMKPMKIIMYFIIFCCIAACSFVGVSVFELTGLVLRDPLVDVPVLLETVAIALVSDLLLGALVVPAVLALDARLEPDRLLA